MSREHSSQIVGLDESFCHALEQFVTKFDVLLRTSGDYLVKSAEMLQGDDPSLDSFRPAAIADESCLHRLCTVMCVLIEARAASLDMLDQAAQLGCEITMVERQPHYSLMTNAQACVCSLADRLVFRYAGHIDAMGPVSDGSGASAPGGTRFGSVIEMALRMVEDQFTIIPTEEREMLFRVVPVLLSLRKQVISLGASRYDDFLCLLLFADLLGRCAFETFVRCWLSGSLSFLPALRSAYALMRAQMLTQLQDRGIDLSIVGKFSNRSRGPLPTVSKPVAASRTALASHKSATGNAGAVSTVPKPSMTDLTTKRLWNKVQNLLAMIGGPDQVSALKHRVECIQDKPSIAEAHTPAAAIAAAAAQKSLLQSSTARVDLPTPVTELKYVELGALDAVPPPAETEVIEPTPPQLLPVVLPADIDEQVIKPLTDLLANVQITQSSSTTAGLMPPIVADSQPSAVWQAQLAELREQQKQMQVQLEKAQSVALEHQQALERQRLVPTGNEGEAENAQKITAQEQQIHKLRSQIQNLQQQLKSQVVPSQWNHPYSPLAFYSWLYTPLYQKPSQAPPKKEIASVDRRPSSIALPPTSVPSATTLVSPSSSASTYRPVLPLMDVTKMDVGAMERIISQLKSLEEQMRQAKAEANIERMAEIRHRLNDLQFGKDWATMEALAHSTAMGQSLAASSASSFLSSLTKAFSSLLGKPSAPEHSANSSTGGIHLLAPLPGSTAVTGFLPPASPLDSVTPAQRRSQALADATAPSSQREMPTSNSVGNIGPPTDVKHVFHIGYNPQRGFDIADIPEDWKTVFNRAGVKQADLTDPQTAKAIFETLKEDGQLDELGSRDVDSDGTMHLRLRHLTQLHRPVPAEALSAAIAALAPSPKHLDVPALSPPQTSVSHALLSDPVGPGHHERSSMAAPPPSSSSTLLSSTAAAIPAPPPPPPLATSPFSNPSYIPPASRARSAISVKEDGAYTLVGAYPIPSGHASLRTLIQDRKPEYPLVNKGSFPDYWVPERGRSTAEPREAPVMMPAAPTGIYADSDDVEVIEEIIYEEIEE